MVMPLAPGASATSDTPESVTVLDGSSFVVADRAGDVGTHRTHGMFFQDTRILSTWQLTVDDDPLDPLAVLPEEAFAATFVARAAPRAGAHDSTVVVRRHRLVGDGLREDIVVSNHGVEPAAMRLALAVDADFADLFDVKEGRAVSRHHVTRHGSGREVNLTVTVEGSRRGVRVSSHDGTAVPGGLSFAVVVPPQGEWRTAVEVVPSVDGTEVHESFPLDQPLDEPAAAARRPPPRRSPPPVVHADHPGVRRALRQSTVDLESLRITDPASGGDIVAAGAPWFMALFGRDSLLTALMALPLDPSLALGTLEALARHQGRRVDLASEEEPGRILHEVRRSVDPSRAPGGRSVYYGSVDATPLFVLLLDEAARWGADPERVSALLPAADAALEWCRTYGDLDGDGFVEYRRKTDRGLANQAWKDSHDSIHAAGGRLAEPPLALVEVQAYVYGAYRARAHLASVVGDADTCRYWLREAEAFRSRFDDAFWLPQRGYYALALDADKRAVDSLTSNVGHALWTGVARPDRVPALVDHLTSDQLLSGWGLRTLAESMSRYNPVSYHNGSVWPHDNALAVAGLARYGEAEAAQRVSLGIMAASESFGGRLPELFCGFSRASTPAPVPYPTSCSPQAWAAATPISLARSLLGLHPCVPHGVVNFRPALPEPWGRLRIEGIRLGGTSLDVDSDATHPAIPAGTGLTATADEADPHPPREWLAAADPGGEGTAATALGLVP